MGRLTSRAHRAWIHTWSLILNRIEPRIVPASSRSDHVPVVSGVGGAGHNSPKHSAVLVAVTVAFTVPLKSPITAVVPVLPVSESKTAIRLWLGYSVEMAKLVAHLIPWDLQGNCEHQYFGSTAVARTT